jgi:hypothetical protein
VDYVVDTRLLTPLLIGIRVWLTSGPVTCSQVETPHDSAHRRSVAIELPPYLASCSNPAASCVQHPPLNLPILLSGTNGTVGFLTFQYRNITMDIPASQPES